MAEMETEIQKVFNRKKELIQRDPLFYELSETFKKGIDIEIHRRQDGSLFDDADTMTPSRPMRGGEHGNEYCQDNPDFIVIDSL